MTHSALATGTQWTTECSSRDGHKIDRFIIHHAATTSLNARCDSPTDSDHTVTAAAMMKNTDATVSARRSTRRLNRLPPSRTTPIRPGQRLGALTGRSPPVGVRARSAQERR